jgi:hypothetical protein
VILGGNSPSEEKNEVFAKSPFGCSPSRRRSINLGATAASSKRREKAPTFRAVSRSDVTKKYNLAVAVYINAEQHAPVPDSRRSESVVHTWILSEEEHRVMSHGIACLPSFCLLPMICTTCSELLDRYRSSLQSYNDAVNELGGTSGSDFVHALDKVLRLWRASQNARNKFDSHGFEHQAGDCEAVREASEPPIASEPDRAEIPVP